MNPPKVSVIIINYNGGAFLQQAVDSLGRQTVRDFELIVFDNASTDGSADTLDLSRVPAGQLVRNPENIGFAGGNNRAADLATGKWLALLNPDTIAEPDWLENLLAAADAYPECRNFASAQFDLHSADTLDGVGDAYLVFGIPWRGGFGRPASELPGMGWCFSACGAAAMYDLALFRELGGFDERFFCYCEDVDLGFRLQLAGYDCLFVNTAVVHHAGSGITGRASAFSTYHGTRNRIWTYFKNMPTILLMVTLPGHIALTLYLAITKILTPRFKPIIRGLFDAILDLPQIMGRSPWKLTQRRVSILDLISKMAWNPFRMSARKAHVRDLTSKPADQ